MVTLTLLLIASILTLLIVGSVVFAGGTVFIVLFADVIVCVLFIVWIMKRITKRKRKD